MAKKDVKVTFMLTPRLNDRLEAYAESIEKTKSEVLRDLIEDYVPEKHPAPRDKGLTDTKP